LQACTIIAKNYAPFARVLARSFHAHHPDGRFHVFVVDGWRGSIDPATEPFELLGPEDLHMPGFHALAKRHDLLRLSAAARPWVMQHLIDRAGTGGTLYLDPDTKVYSSLMELGSLAVRHGLALVPHLTRPLARDAGRSSEMDILGTYSLGSVGLGRGEQVEDLLQRWAEQLETGFRIDPAEGSFVAERWIDFAPGLVDAAIVRDPGYDVAYWNLDRREVTRSEDGYLVNDRPLRFFHFSAYDPLTPHRLSKHQNKVQLDRQPVIRELCDEYRLDLLEAGFPAYHARLYRPRTGGLPPTARTPTAGMPSGRLPAPPPRSLRRRILDLENLIRALRLSGADSFTIAREVTAAVNPFRNSATRTTSRESSTFLRR
jgi:hypothetical protein